MLPKYEIIKRDTIEKIESGGFSTGEKVYSEGDLKRKHNVSNTTVAETLNDLVNEGYLIRCQGEGTFIKKNLKHRRALSSGKSSISSNERQKSVEETITLVSEEFTDKEVTQMLGGKLGSRALLKLTRIALTSDLPWKTQNCYLFVGKLRDDSVKRLIEGVSLSDELNLQGNMANLLMTMEVNAILLTKDSDELEPLGIIRKSFDEEDSFSLFSIKRLIRGNGGIPIGYSQSFILFDFYQIEIISGQTFTNMATFS